MHLRGMDNRRRRRRREGVKEARLVTISANAPERVASNGGRPEDIRHCRRRPKEVRHIPPLCNSHSSAAKEGARVVDSMSHTIRRCMRCRPLLVDSMRHTAYTAPTAPTCIRQHTSAYVSIRQHTREHTAPTAPTCV